MPLQRCSAGQGRPGWRWGDSGRCYDYPAGDETASLAAKKMAIRQGLTLGKLEKSLKALEGLENLESCALLLPENDPRLVWAPVHPWLATVEKRRPFQGMHIETLGERRYHHPDGAVAYVVRTEKVRLPQAPASEAVELRSAYTSEGTYIGSPRMARFLCMERGIAPELNSPEHVVCSVGLSRDGRWYGWSHRAIQGFKAGDMLFEENFPGADESTPFRLHGRKVITTDADARQAAVNFASYVS